MWITICLITFYENGKINGKIAFGQSLQDKNARKGWFFMKTYVCEEHVEIALDKAIYENALAPIFKELKEDESLSTTCEYCNLLAVYMVGN
ncbi:CxxH/CxxC protein [Heyndrickxia vini]